ncbi:hypothetical protein HBA55_34990 [Pseudomaricurvus alkylphenolicus]|uniref:hypothetical protein n=1 Tax=Pseudomaricurvus alkylphenolicus TaxID=1306991 RepID=UPI0014214BD9|nr:hypothetical protein [Pseudomaricurvus alkylphenolicus]NIB44840.1 hypothetical protein [Pseudomaricurvus alkylphenolicus]
MDNHQLFYAMINKVPRIARLWDQDTNDLKLEDFERQLGVMSSGEVQLAKFFAAVWFNDNTRYGFDVVDAVSTLNPHSRKIVIDWLIKPFYP